MSDKPEKWIFVSSPSDVAAERVIADRVFRRLAREFDDVVTLKLLLWEFEPLFAHGGFQRQIRAPSECDLMVTMLWTRLGTRLPAEFAPGPGLPPPTGTEYEIREALAGHARSGRPDVLIYVKKESPAASLDAKDLDERRRQFVELQNFCKELFYDESGASVVAHHSFRDSAEFERKLLEHARKWLHDQLDAIDIRPRWTLGSPFRGLKAFDADYRDVFFGRSQAIGDLIRRLNETENPADPEAERSRLLLVAGMSGNGKTSVIQAGLLPQLEYLPVEGIAAWDTVTLRPSDVDDAVPELLFFAALAARIIDRVGVASMPDASVTALARELAEKPDAAVVRIENALWQSANTRRHSPAPAHVRLLIYLDQLEELFTLPALASRIEAALTLLVRLARSARIWVVATLRSDFVYKLEAHADFMALLGHSPPYTLLPPRGAELADMIREPAIAAGLRFEERDGVTLDAEILHEASLNPESLPLLGYALDQLYERRDGRTLLWDVYRPAGKDGGLRGSLVAVAEGLLGTQAEDIAFRRVMRELTSVSEDGSATRRYAPLAGFAEGSPERALLHRLIDARLCVTDTQGRNPVVCLAHEALLQSWPRVHRWLVQESSLLRLRDELQRDAKAWHSHGRKDDWLGTAPDKLMAIEQIERESLLPAGIETDYARRSRRHASFKQRIKQGVIAALCVLGIVSAIAGWLALKQRDLARQQAETASRTSAFMVAMFQGADPEQSRGDKITVRELLDKGAHDISMNLVIDNKVRADLLAAMGESYKGLGLYEPANRTLQEALSLRRLGGGDLVSLVDVLNSVADLKSKQADYVTADKIFREALALRAAGDRDRRASEQRTASLAGLGAVLREEGKYADATKMLEEALALDRKLYGEPAAPVAHVLFELGVTRQAGGNTQGAIKDAEQAVAMYRELYGSTPSPSTAEAINELAGIVLDSGDFDRAEKLYVEALAIKRRVYGDKHPEIAAALNNVAEAQEQRGDLKGAEANYRAALAMEHELLGNVHPRIAETLNNLAFVEREQGRVEEALDRMREALRVESAVHGGDHPRVAVYEDHLGFWLMRAGNLAEATPLLTQALAIRERLVGKDHPDYAASLVHLAILDVTEGHYADALAKAGSAHAIFEKEQPGQWRSAVAKATEGAALSGLGRTAEATPILARSLAILKADRGAPLDYVQLVERYARGQMR